MSDSSRPGWAVTWIGAQSHDDRGPFIQLGSYSYLLPPSTGKADPADLGPFYGIFWSDTERHFQAVPIVGLKHAGDLIAFQMKRNASGWRLTVHNQTFGWTRSLEVHYGAEGLYNQGEWLQEDPASAMVTTTDVPFADTSVVSFDRLRLNGKSPKLKYADAQALSTLAGTYLVPTRIRNDGFSLEPATGPARQYLADAEALDSRLYPLAEYFILGHRENGFSASRTEADATDSYVQFGDQLGAQVWPSADSTLVRQIEHNVTQLKSLPDIWGGLAPPISPLSVQRILVPRNLRLDTNRLRAKLGLPPI